MPHHLDTLSLTAHFLVDIIPLRCIQFLCTENDRISIKLLVCHELKNYGVGVVCRDVMVKADPDVLVWYRHEPLWCQGTKKSQHHGVLLNILLHLS